MLDTYVALACIKHSSSPQTSFTPHPSYLEPGSHPSPDILPHVTSPLNPEVRAHVKGVRPRISEPGLATVRPGPGSAALALPRLRCCWLVSRFLILQGPTFLRLSGSKSPELLASTVAETERRDPSFRKPLRETASPHACRCCDTGTAYLEPWLLPCWNYHVHGYVPTYVLNVPSAMETDEPFLFSRTLNCDAPETTDGTQVRHTALNAMTDTPPLHRRSSTTSPSARAPKS